MRAPEYLATLDGSDRQRLASLLRAESAEPEALVRAMRQSVLADHVLGLCDIPAMWEDVYLLCANPFAPVLSDELVEPAAFLRIGLIAPAATPGSFRVNLDMALSMLPSLPVEFGFFCTLTSRLPQAQQVNLGRQSDLGPRACHVDYLLDLSTRRADPTLLQEHVARVCERERELLWAALEEGELPDGVHAGVSRSELPQVGLGAGVPGQLGLLFSVRLPQAPQRVRNVVPLELAPVLPSLLKTVPAAPERGDAKKPLRRKATTGRTPRVTGSSLPSPTSISASFDLPGLAPAAPVEDTASSAPTKILRAAQLQSAAAIVDLEQPAAVRRVRQDATLGPRIASIIEERWVALQPGTDVDAWVEEAAKRLRWSAHRLAADNLSSPPT